MRIPNADQATIDPVKLHGYLLSPAHPVGRFKERFFVALGYTPDNWRRLEADLRAQHLSQEAELGAVSWYGQKYEIRAMMTGPAGRSAEVVSVWIVLANEDIPRFLTAYPGGAR